MERESYTNFIHGIISTIPLKLLAVRGASMWLYTKIIGHGQNAKISAALVVAYHSVYPSWAKEQGGHP